MTPTFLSHRLALAADQLAELAGLALAPLPSLGKEYLAQRQQSLAAELALLAGLAAQEAVLATAQTGGEAAA